RPSDRRPALRRSGCSAGIGGVRAGAALGGPAARACMNEAVGAFLLGFPALFSIVNPISGAFIFGAVTAGRFLGERNALARKVGVFSFIVMMVALWAGALVLAVFGITLAALRVAGGVVVALTAWELLNRPEHGEARKQEQAAPVAASEDIAPFPM